MKWEALASLFHLELQMNRRKAKEARLRELKRKEQEQEEKRLAENFERLKTMSSGLLTGRWSGLKEQKSNVPKSARVSPVVTLPYRREQQQIVDVKPLAPVIETKQTIPVARIKSKMTPEEYARREALAQQEIERKKKRVGILVNKSCYQYITDETDLTTLGRK